MFLTPVRTYVRVRDYSFTITEHDLKKPWLVLGSEHRTVSLEDGVRFFEWASKQWPEPRWTVQLDPWQSMQAWPTNGQ